MTRANEFTYLSDAVMAGLGITTGEVVGTIEHLLREQAASRVWTAPKAAVWNPDGRYFMATLAVADDPPLFAVKAVVLNPDPPEPGLQQINGMVTVLDSRTGLPVAIMDGNWITAVRTAGLSATAAKRLARPDASVAAFIGCGVQAHSHLQAFGDLFPLREVRVFGRGTANRDSLCEAAEAKGYTAVASASGQEAIEEADLIVTSITLSADVEPFLDAAGMKPGAFAAVTDFAVPWRRESFAALDRIVVDDLEQERTNPQPLADPRSIDGDLLGLVTGGVEGRAGGAERSAFMFRGLAVGDLALAGLAYRKAAAAGKGSRVGD